MDYPLVDRSLMPDFPGVAKAESAGDWDTSFPLVHTIRPKDDEYWRKYRGTPKAFVTLAAGQKMWANRFGNLTAVRFPFPQHNLAFSPGYLYATEIERAIQRVFSALLGRPGPPFPGPGSVPMGGAGPARAVLGSNARSAHEVRIPGASSA
jgi:hypothetical protein